MTSELALHLKDPRELFVFDTATYEPLAPDELGQSGMEYLLAHTSHGVRLADRSQRRHGQRGPAGQQRGLLDQALRGPALPSDGPLRALSGRATNHARRSLP
jgi:hypothetical protein